MIVLVLLSLVVCWLLWSHNHSDWPLVWVEVIHPRRIQCGQAEPPCRELVRFRVGPNRSTYILKLRKN
jgi:hypothetical protein